MTDKFTHPSDAPENHEWENAEGTQVFHIGMGKDGGYVWQSEFGSLFFDHRNKVRDRAPTPATPQTGYSWTNSARQDAPETMLLEKMEKARGGGEVVKLTKSESRLMLDMAIRAVELDAAFDMQWKAQMRGVERWREETGENLTLPDTADFTVWMLEKISTSDARIAGLEASIKDAILLLCEMDSRSLAKSVLERALKTEQEGE